LKLGIRGKLFFVSLGIILISLAVADAYLTRALEQDLTERVRADLEVRLRLVERGATELRAGLEDRAAWDALADDYGERSEVRVTLIGLDGLVLGDSELDLAELPRAENHARRPEVRQAIAAGYGVSERRSATVNERLLYMAVPFGKGTESAGVARVAKPLTEVDHAISRVRRLVLVGFGVSLLVAVFMSSLAAQWMSKAVRSLTAAARRMAAGDLAARTGLAGEDEVAELGRALDQLAASLATAVGQLRTERDLLSRVLDGMREGVLLLDREGRVALANPALREMLLLGADIAGKLPLEVIRNAELKRLLDRARSAAETVSGEIELGDLKPRRVLLHAAALPDAPGGLLAVFVDVTDLRRLEMIRREFVANVSHELRTPIATIRSAAETLRRAMEAGPEATDEFIAIIERQAERLQHLVEDLLDLSRIEARQFQLKLEPVEIGEITAQLLPAFRERAEAKRMRLITDVPRSTSRARADSRALEQVLTNLVENAVKYGSEGGTVTVRAVPRDGKIRVEVADSGPGIEAAHLPRLFERFYRVDAGRSRELGGTGLGLSIVKHLVEAMSGGVEVESTLGRGTTFAVTLPRAGDGSVTGHHTSANPPGAA
jgi:two-component system, OmpR family, phosphate regulon sensor histidine kinase PhoR